MIILSKYDAERAILAGEVAKELGIREIPSKLMDLAIYTSEMPDLRGDIKENETIYTSLPERTLLSMPLIYSHEATLSVVLPNGHTAIFPNSDIIKKELVNCGYLLCEYGELTPVMKNHDPNSHEFEIHP